MWKIEQRDARFSIFAKKISVLQFKLCIFSDERSVVLMKFRGYRTHGGVVFGNGGARGGKKARKMRSLGLHVWGGLIMIASGQECIFRRKSFDL